MRSASRMIALALAAASAVLIGPEALAQYPQDAATAGVSDTTVASGQPVTVGGEGWRPGSSVELRLPRRELGAARVDERGAFTTEVTIPPDAGGEQLIRVSGTSLGGEPSEIRIRMLVGGSPSRPSEVDFTAGNISLWVLIALALFGLGIGAVLRGRARSSRSEQPQFLQDV